MSWFSSHINRWSEAAREGAASVFGADGGGASSSAAEIRRVEVVWGKQHLQLVLPRAAQPPTLRNLKDEILAHTAVPLEQQKLIFQGLRLKDDRQPLSAFGIREGSKLTLVGTAGGVSTEDAAARAAGSGSIPAGRLAAEEAERARRAREADDSEEGLLRRIEQTLKGVEEDLAPEVLQLEHAIAQRQGSTSSQPTPTPTASAPASAPGAAPDASGAAAAPPPPAQQDPAATQQLDTKQLTNLHRKLSELLLRALLALDTIPVNSDSQRTARKGAVRKVQAYLDRVDQAWETYKSNVKATGTAQL